MAALVKSTTMATPADEAREELFAALRPHLETTEIRIGAPDLLVAVYNRSGKKTSGGIIIPDTYREDEFQGITGLVIQLGAHCRGEKYEDWWGGNPPKVGDWVGFEVRRGTRYLIGDQLCRQIQWEYILFISRTPDLTV